MPTTLTKQTIILSTIAREGGYSDHPLDRGGVTNYGITEAVAAKHKRLLMSPPLLWNGKMKSLTITMAVAIYDLAYWQPIRGDVLLTKCECLADRLFDMAVNMGVPTAGTILQRALNVLNNREGVYGDLVVDGIIGEKTFAAFDALIAARGNLRGRSTLLKVVISMQRQRYVEITEGREANEAFIVGWINRAESNLSLYEKILNPAA